MKKAFLLLLLCLLPFFDLQAGNGLNILLIVADDLGYEKLGAYGGVDTHTPQVDRMAEEMACCSPKLTPVRSAPPPE